MLELIVAAAIAAASQPADVYFRTPTGTIGCRASYTPESWLRCDIVGGIKPLPPAPKDCQLDWGGGFELPKTGAAVLTCAGDTVMEPKARVIPAGTTWRQGGFTCESQASSFRCTNAGGRGFFLSKDHSYRF